jgi:hypothetical protein
MAILATEKVLTLDWWKPASKLVVGDYVFDKDGKIVQVKLVQQYHSENCKRVTFNDHLSVSGDTHLNFMVEDLKYRNRVHQYVGRFQFRRPLKQKSVEDLQETPLRDKRERLVYSVPTTRPLELPHQTLPVPPFVFGLWFFNRKSKGQFSVQGIYHDDVVQKLKDYGYKVMLGKKLAGGRREFTITPSIESQLAPNIPNKITNNYLLASPEQRLELLQGIMVAKPLQYNQKIDRFRFSSQNLPTVLRIQSLVESLGSKTTIEHSETNNTYRLFFKTRLQLVSNQQSPPVKVHLGRRYIKKITKIEPQMCVHIETTSKDSTILVGEGFIPCR